ncbi:antichymotrypsin-2-like isoform X2 [Phymastichus coffea]|nr:antichymotrypsin-2-like isoform X2 [Phymastichus coffea]
MVFSTENFQDECQESEDCQSISNSCNKFSSKFIQILTSNQKQDNILISSFSVYTILSVLFHGADEVTKEQLKSGLYLLTPGQLGNEFKQLLKSLRSVREAELEIADAIFISTNFSLKQEFLSISKDIHEINIEDINVQDSPGSSRKVNSWIKDKTKGKINDILSSSDIDDYTSLILVNALYFKSAWLQPFDPQSTEKRKFYSINGITTFIPTMYKTINLPHGTIPSLDASFIKLKYKSEVFEMIIILPKEKDGLHNLEKHFEWHLVSGARYFMKEVELFLPKFKLENTLDLKRPLQKFGITSIFQETANFDNLAHESVYVSTIKQKLFVEVDEKGSEAAAATVAQIRSRRMIVKSDYFKVDHPFMFIINHKPSNIPLFIGSIRKLGEVKDEL